MFYNVLVTLLVSTLVFNDGKYVICTDNAKTIDTLNMLLEFPGWNKISNWKVQFPEYLIGESFSVSDILYRNIEESNKIVTDNNYTMKFEMIVFSLSCVYANELVKFINLTKNISHISKMERQRLNTQNYRKQLRENTREVMKNGIDENDNLNKPSSSVQNSDELLDAWKMLNSAIKQFQKSWLMFECMSEALRFLKELVPQGYFERYLPELINFGKAVLSYKGISKNMKIALPDYNGEDDSCYQVKISDLSRAFALFLNDTQPLDRFLNQYCIIPKNNKPMVVEEKDVFKTFFKKPSSVKDKFQVIQQLEVQIESLVHGVIQNYFIDLGFVLGLETIK